MPALYAGRKTGKPILRGRTHNAMINGKLVWPLDRDIVVGVTVTDDKGKPLPRSLPVNGTLKLGAKATYADGHQSDLLTVKDVVFASKDTATATVSGNTLTWVHGGTVLVTATIGGFTSAAVSIAAAYAPESIRVVDEAGKTLDSLTLRVGEDINLAFNVLPAEASQEVTATIGDATIAAIDKPKPRGITVTDKTGKTVESLTLRVGEAQTLNISVLPSDASQDVTATVVDSTVARILEPLAITSDVTSGSVGADVTLAAQAPDNATGLTLAWTSSDSSVAAFTKLGAQPMHKILTLLKEGTATITCKHADYLPATIKFTVTATKE